MNSIPGFNRAQREYERQLPPEPDRQRICKLCRVEYNFDDTGNETEDICDPCYNKIYEGQDE